ncbi:MAG TPA: ISKra4 family transposase [Chthonomonadaceae bacterium]|nr:ISKra4 family transposase [Chthonomonadaceae bacterium]
MPDARPTPEEEALIQKLLKHYETQLRQTLRNKPGTLEQIEDAAEEVGIQVKRDIQEQLIRQEGTGDSGKQTACSCGAPARYVADYTRRVVTRYGVLWLERAYYYCKACRSGFCPLDARLHLGAGESSPAVVGLCARFAGYLPPRAAARELRAVCGIGVSANTVQAHARRVGVALQQEWEREESAFFTHPDKVVTERPGQLQMTLDGVMVFVEGAWHEVKLGCAYTRGRSGGVARIRYTATLAASSAFGKRLRTLGHLCGADNTSRVGIGADGAEWVWQQVSKYFPTRTQIVDYYHVLEHLWEVAHARFPGEGEAAQAWIERQQARLLSDRVGEVIQDIGQWHSPIPDHQDLRRRVATYLHTHAHRMRYQTFAEQGYHIGSGVAEAGCKAVVQARLKGPGMRWKQAGAEAILHLRCGVCSTKQPDFRQLARQTLTA